MQTFETNQNKESCVKVGNYEVKVVKASSLREGTHRVRFYPISSQFYEGGDNVSIVQQIHWVGKKPIICRAKSFDYSVPETQDKPRIGGTCVICSDASHIYRRHEALKEIDKQESEKLYSIYKDIRATKSGASIVSFIDTNGNLQPPVILRYTKQLLERIEFYAERMAEGTKENPGIHICDPVRGYTFDIIIGKNKKGFRSYDNSMPSVGASIIDITKAPWDWKEVAETIKGEILTVLSEEEVYAAYTNSFRSSSMEVLHPMAKGDSHQVNTVTQNSYTPPSDTITQNSYTPPSDTVNTQVGGFVSPSTNIVPKVEGKLFPCHAKSPGGSGYVETDSNCKSCPQKLSCDENTAPFETTPSSSGEGHITFNQSSIDARLQELTNRMNNK